MSERYSLREIQTLCLERGIPFYACRLPGNDKSLFGAQSDNQPVSSSSMKNLVRERGFIVEPFCAGEKNPPVFIRGDIYHDGESAIGEDILSQLRALVFTKKTLSSFPGDNDKQLYSEGGVRMIGAMKEGQARKIVLARTITVPCEVLAMAPDYYARLVERYPDAFVFLVSVPGVMTWMGATPEVFLRQSAEGVETMALAGTKSIKDNEGWGEKELEEQQIVTDYISDVLDRTGSGGWMTKGPFSKHAGSVMHLCTTFKRNGRLDMEKVEVLRRELHPTPAVGGFPKREALEIINHIEGFDRRYYAGYLGPVHVDGTFDWFVNLRSMELNEEGVRLYVGGGLTALSDVEKEWQETGMKAETLLRIIDKKYLV